MKLKASASPITLIGTITEAECWAYVAASPPSASIKSGDWIAPGTCRLSTSTSTSTANIEAGAGYIIWEPASNGASKYYASNLRNAGFCMPTTSTSTATEYSGCLSDSGSITDSCTNN